MTKICLLRPSLQEFDLLHYSLSSACILFRADLTAEEERDKTRKEVGVMRV